MILEQNMSSTYLIKHDYLALGCKVAETPIEPNMKFTINKSKGNEGLETILETYWKINLSVTCAVSMTSRFMDPPRSTHFEDANRILRYLKETLGKIFH